MFLNLKNSVTGSDQTIVDEVEAGEDHIKARFEEALRPQILSASLQEAVTTVYGVIKADHDQMRDLKRDLKANRAS